MSEKKSLMPLAAITTVLLLAVITRPNPEESPKDGLGTPMVPFLKANAEAIEQEKFSQFLAQHYFL